MFCVIISVIQCNNQNTKENTDIINQKYYNLYSGKYSININDTQNNFNYEVYQLYPNGQSKWVWFKRTVSGIEDVIEQKAGIWQADSAKIKIIIDGKQGKIVEEYIIKDGIFKESTNRERYLELISNSQNGELNL